MYCGYQRYFCHGLRIEPELYCVHCLLKSDCQNDVSTIFKNYNKQLCLQPFSNKFVSLLYSFVLSYNGRHMILDGCFRFGIGSNSCCNRRGKDFSQTI
jgi:hypothetical protein